MKLGYLALSALCALVACAAPPVPDAGAAIIGYRYHDANHTGGVSQASPQAIYNGSHGVWLWPPAGSIRPG